MSKIFKRKNYFIKKDLQGRMILGYFVFVIIGCVVFSLILAFLSADTMTISYTDNDLQLGRTPLMLIKQTVAAHWVFMIIGGSLLVLATMFITHRVAGPIFRFEKALKSMINGRLDETIHLRSSDEGKELAALINTFNADLSQTIGQIREESRSIDDLLILCEQLHGSGANMEDFGNVHEVIKKKNSEIHALSTSFTLVDAEKKEPL
ncbi:MAG: methyl-accepting chemotaxis protein [Thermodesulfobacteriota bacterium]